MVNNLIIEETKYTPKIVFDVAENRLEIKGRSYPENTSSFYKPVFNWLEEYLENIEKQKVIVNLEIMYFNSSSSKVLLDFFDLLEEAAVKGADITVNWYYEPDIEETYEFGEEFQEDLEAVKFNLVEKRNA